MMLPSGRAQSVRRGAAGVISMNSGACNLPGAGLPAIPYGGIQQQQRGDECVTMLDALRGIS